MQDLIYLLGISLIGSFLALIGGFVFLFNKKLSASLAVNSIPFAAGVLITVAIVGLLPESVDAIGEQAFVVVLLSFLGLYVFEHLFFGLHHHDDKCKHTSHDHIHHDTTIPLVIFGDTIHNFIDGVAIGAGFLINPGLGLVTAISTLLHEIPHEIGDFGIMLKEGWSKKKIILINVISSSLTILGAFLVFYLPVSDYVIGVLMAISAGTFLYLGASDFLPQIEETNGGRIRTLVPLILGVVIMLGTLILIPHAHEEVHLENNHIIEDIEHKAEG